MAKNKYKELLDIPLKEETPVVSSTKEMFYATDILLEGETFYVYIIEYAGDKVFNKYKVKCTSKLKAIDTVRNIAFDKVMNNIKINEKLIKGE